MVKACVGTLNVWDYLEVTTGLNRGDCKRVAIMAQINDRATVMQIAKEFDIAHHDVVSVQTHLRKWTDWVERRGMEVGVGGSYG